MRPRPSPMSALGVSAAMAALFVCGATEAQTIIPLSQERFISTAVNASHCGGEWLGNFDEAKEFEPFVSFIETVHGCDLSFAFGAAGQRSQIDLNSMTALGSAAAEAVAGIPNVIHAFADSIFEVTFELPSVSEFALGGELSAAGGEPVLWSVALVRLVGPGGDLIFEHTVAPGPNGEPNTESIEQMGGLEPGQYTLQAEALVGIDSKVPPRASGEASFDLTFEAADACPADLDGNGTVGILDLLALLAAWGTDPGGPPDFDLDGTVGILDLLTLLANWGPCP